MKRLPVLVVAFSAALLAAPTVIAQEDTVSFRARLVGTQEVPLVSTPGRGEFTAEVSEDGSSVAYELSYRNLQADITQSHIHLAKPLTNGGISVWLCGTDALPGPTGTPRCVGARTGGVTGVFTAANVIGPTSQGISPGEFRELIANMKKGFTYANVHTTQSPGGEIRGQIGSRGGGRN
jgi:hypothetical protein